MDDKKVFELKRLELAYNKQLIFMGGVILLSLIGLAVYVYNVYNYSLSLLLVAIMLIVVGIISIFNIDQHMKDISKKIKGL